VVYGSRFQHGERRVLYFWHSIGNRALTLAGNMLADLNLTDMLTCYKAMRREIAQNIELTTDHFGIECELTLKLARLPLSIYEVPINYYGRTYAQGKKVTWGDGFIMLGSILKTAFSRRPFVRDRAALEAVLATPPPEPEVGIETLEAFESARNYNGWIFSRFAPCLGPRVIEIGSGIGNIVQECLAHPAVQSVTATDLDEKGLAILRDRFGDEPRLNLVAWAANPQLAPELVPGTYDTVICSNVLEHIEDHAGALDGMHQLLAPGGRLVLLVPAHAWAYSAIDRDLGHWRRYSAPQLRSVVSQAGFVIDKLFEHNVTGLAGWLWEGKVLRRQQLGGGSVGLFDKLVPVLRRVDPLLTQAFPGVSLICIAHKA
jgi:2-polyprenyl-3-methyl-5-hydroxy-6-metoxy-1,4-benzoquinol methylase